ncbi:tRNA (N6-isopentenyl adenosine(37)-C2)-methylthiotransferase MiaB [Martelella endophytica]|uniref:tRNA-2-methylthio-N(6)-dimethylallyladenosine synthase n=1 Tax=Martelella endophytica TaxID=1486262 RepID=A0A0D5LTG8_MAREN|nr:tRNA (N6-isopentenyl adenosine(37)-C2)-methylthiotransferase MiaB [Martelella endophytica]AJY47356.1 (dimethylallyl)adenosine tRNA methylthiotransferase [Martelella endophytica]
MTEQTTLIRQSAATAADNQRKVFIKTYGCQMNVYDSERMGEALAADGYQPTDNVEDADLILLNTCHIREKAAEKVYSALGRYRDLKAARAAEGRETLIGVAGCVAQAEGEEILRRSPAVDVVIGPQTYHRLPQALVKAKAGERVVDTEYAVEDKFDYLPKKERGARPKNVSAFLTVQEGCDKFCTFCVVPYTRGAEISRSLKQILDEARRLAENGVREITLLGQNVNAWHGESEDGAEWGLGDLLFELASIEGIARLRYTTSHPRDMDDRLMQAHRELGKLMPYLHLPVQAGSDRILKAMNRKHTAEEYLALIERIREARPDIAMSGDFIVGFPGETEEDFQATLALVERVRYAQAFSFKYSPRPGTPGAELTDQVPEDEKAGRLQRLQALLTRHQLEFAQSRIGMEMDILLEKPGRNEGQMIGRSPWLQSVVVAADESEIGQMVRVKITEASANSLAATRIG